VSYRKKFCGYARIDVNDTIDTSEDHDDLSENKGMFLILKP